MKQKLIFVIMALFLVTAFSACGKVTTVNQNEDTLKEVPEPTREETQSEASQEVTAQPITETEPTNMETEPTNTETEPTNAPDYEETNLNDPIIITAPPFEYYRSDKVIDKENQPISLNMISSEPNKIIDDEEWFINNNIEFKTYKAPNSYQIGGNLPDGIDKTWNDLILTKAFYDDSYIYCTYGSSFLEGNFLKIYDAKSLKVIYSLDFSNYSFPPDIIQPDYGIVQKIDWAQIKDNILYISHSHSTYAESSNYMNAYITAIDLSDKSILWRTNALICNSYNFFMIDDVIICGYGFTNEDDYLYQVDIHTGKVLEETPLKTAASYIIKKDSTLFVRTYNTDYEFEITEKK